MLYSGTNNRILHYVPALVLHYVRALRSCITFLQLHSCITFLHYISVLHFCFTFLHYISTLHFYITILHYNSALHFCITFLHYFSILRTWITVLGLQLPRRRVYRMFEYERRIYTLILVEFVGNEIQYFTLPHTFRPDPGGMVGIQVNPGGMVGIW